jgi:tetratricopeptide (TPR) repeat protein
MDAEKHEPDQIIAQGRALVRAIESIEALGAIASTDPVAAELTTAYKRQLQLITETAPHPAAEAILKEQVLVRSRRRCCVCHQFAGEDINVYHINTDVKDPPRTLGDAIVLCLRCHAEAVYAGSQRIADNEYSIQELHRYRDLWWEWCEEHPDINIPTSLPGIYGEHLYMPFPPPGPDVIPEPGPLPPGSRLLFPRNEFFVGRAEVLSALARALLPQPQSPPIPVLITQATQGLGGIGKTQLAVEFAYRYGRFFYGVHWLNGSQLNNLNAELALCGEEMDLPHWPEKQPEQVARTFQEWQGGGTRLVILDDLEDTDIDIVRGWLNRLSGGPIRLLITAKGSDWSTDLGLNLLPLDVFTIEESLALLNQHLPQAEASDATMELLANQLAGLPLALDLAGRYLAVHPHLSAINYLRLLQTVGESPSTAAWRESLGNLTKHDLRLAAAFALSWEAMTKEADRRLFLLASHCAPNCPIPYQILEEAAALGTDACDKSVATLASLGLVQIDEAGPIVHPLLAQYVRKLPEAEGALQALTTAMAWLAYAANTRMDRTNTPSWFVPLLPHVCAVIESAEKGPMRATEAMGMIRNSLGYYLDRVADHTQARRSFESALGVWQEIYGEISPQAATAHSNLGSALQGLGDLQGAIESFERALAIDEGIFGPDHPDVAKDLNDLGDALEAIGDPKGAWSAYVCALAILEHVLGTDHPDVATQLTKLGTILIELNDLERAREAFERALSILEKLLPPAHPRVRAARVNLSHLDSVASRGDLASLSRAAMRLIHTDGPERYFMCPDCGTVREEVDSADGTIAETSYHGLDDGVLSQTVIERAREILEQTKSRRSRQDKTIEKLRTFSDAHKAHPASKE